LDKDIQGLQIFLRIVSTET